MNELAIQINSYCNGGEYDNLNPSDRIDVQACELEYGHLVSLSMTNLMFLACDSWCLYDVYDPVSVAYFFEDGNDVGCFRRQFRSDEASRCFHEYTAEADYASLLGEEFCAESKTFSYILCVIS